MWRKLLRLCGTVLKFFIHTEHTFSVTRTVRGELWNKGVPIHSHFHSTTIPIHLTISAATHLSKANIT